LTLTLGTNVACCAWVIVVAGGHDVLVLTAPIRKAEVFGAGIVIGAIEVTAADALSSLALVLGGTGIVVITK
jgi:hypothetical protein